MTKSYGRILGFDLGAKTIGLAISDVNQTIATPMCTLKRRKFMIDVQSLCTIFTNHNVKALIIGLPLNMNGSAGPRVQATRDFSLNLRKFTNLPIAFWDERLSTVAVERIMIKTSMSRKKRAEKIDAAAASFMLQGALNRLADLNPRQLENFWCQNKDIASF